VLSAALTGAVLAGILVVLLMMSGSAARKALAPFATELAAKHLLYSRGQEICSNSGRSTPTG